MSALADETRWMDAVDQAALIAKGEVTPLELLEAAIERIERLDPALNAVVMRWFEQAREVAVASDLPDGPFRGVPFLLKDLYSSHAGQTLSNGNAALRAAAVVDTSDTTLVGRYKAAGLVIAGRTNSPEMGSLPVTQPVAWGATRNPWDLDRTPGGSSGGAAAAVAAGMVPFAHASDGGGSIRIPASCCGLVGLKPSQGRTSIGPRRAEAGLSVEHCVSRTVRDSAALLDAVRGPGVGDTVIAPPPARPYAEEIGADPGRLSVGLLDTHPRGEFLHDDCAAAARSAGTMLEGLGHAVEPGWPEALADPEPAGRFMTLWATQMAMAAKQFGEILGRELAADELEPVNRAPGGNGRALQRRRPSYRTGGDVRLPPADPTVVGRRLGPPDHADAGRAAAADRRVRARSERRDGPDAPGLVLLSIHTAVQHERPAGGQPAAPLERRRPPHRRATRRRLRAGGPAVPGRRPTRGGAPLGRAVTPKRSDAARFRCGFAKRCRNNSQSAIPRHLTDMETTVPRHHPPTSAPWGASTVRLGTVVSLVGAVAAILLRWLTHVADPAIIAAVMVVGFVLSWRATARHDVSRS